MKKQIIVTMLLAAALWHSQSFYESGSKVEADANGRWYTIKLHRATLLAGSRSVSILTILKKNKYAVNRLEIDRLKNGTILI